MILMAAALMHAATPSPGAGQRAGIVMPKVVGDGGCARPDDPASRRLGSLRFTRDDFLAALETGIALRAAKKEPLPEFLLCYDPAAEAKELERSAMTRTILHRHGLTAAQYLDRMWALMLALIYPEVLEHNTDAIRANRDLTADPQIKRLLSALNPD